MNTLQQQNSQTPEAKIKAVPQGLSITLAAPRSFLWAPFGQRMTIQRWRKLIPAFLGIVGISGGIGFVGLRIFLGQLTRSFQSSLFEAIVLMIVVLFLLGGSAVVGLAGFASLLSGLLGREQILFHDDLMSIRLSFAGKTTRQTTYAFARIKKFRHISDPQKDQGHLCFKYNDRSIECCQGVGSSEAQALAGYMSQIVDFHCHSVETVVFGKLAKLKNEAPHSILHNPDVTDVRFPFLNLRQVMIENDSYDLYLVERFLTYAVNYLGQEHLKEHVDVYVYGNPEKLQSNLRNNLINLCKQLIVC